jgi:hypothetical protein
VPKIARLGKNLLELPQHSTVAAADGVDWGNDWQQIVVRAKQLRLGVYWLLDGPKLNA